MDRDKINFDPNEINARQQAAKISAEIYKDEQAETGKDLGDIIKTQETLASIYQDIKEDPPISQ